MLFFRHWRCKKQPNVRVILLCIIVWFLDTLSTKVFSGYTATRSLQSHSMGVIDWTLSWFGRPESIMGPSLCRLQLYGMLECYFYFLPLLWQTLDPSPLIVLLCQRWKHMTILRMVIMHLILFMSIMDIMSIILIMCIAVWLELIGSQIVYELDHRKPVLYVIPIENILGKLPVVPVGDTGTILHHLHNFFFGAPGDRKPGSGDGCRMWFVNSWALSWSRDL